MIKKYNGIPAHGMQFELLTVDQKKAILKLRARRLVRSIIESAVFWLVIGLFIGMCITGYAVTDALNQVDKIMVCK